MKVFRSDEIHSVSDSFEIMMTTDRSQFAVMVLQNGQKSGEMGTDHPQSDQFLLVLEGTGQLVLKGEDIHLDPGDAVIIPAGIEHQVVGTSEHPFRTVNVYAPVAYTD
jgi:mannose-6-phosphate isomerase-like protein (cupin superfamily)